MHWNRNFCKHVSINITNKVAHYLWMIFDWNVDLLCVYDGGAVAVGQDEGFLHVPVDLEQVAAHLADL